MNFQDFDFPEALSSAIARINYVELTPIQEKVIPLVLAGKDVLASSHTGSGKTGAFAIPLVAKLLATEQDTALILTPTRELATQVMAVVRSLTSSQHNKIRTALLIGGDPIGKQYAELRSNPRVIVGTPGRVNDHLKRKTLNLSKAKFLVLDETDRMLDMGFSIQLETIVQHLPKPRQTLLFSATISKQIEKLSQKYLDHYEFVKFGEDRAVAPNLKQENLNVTDQNKYSILVEELDKRTGSILVFVKTKHSAQNLADKLVKHNHLASAIHGDLKQRQRDRVMKSFRTQTHRIMVATDIAARGLDISHIEHVINYDPPQLATDYIHRIGRTARAGREGSSLNLVSEKDRKKWQEIKKMLAGGEPKDLDMSPRFRRGDDNRSAAPRRRFDDSRDKPAWRQEGRGENRGRGPAPRTSWGQDRRDRDDGNRPPRPPREEADGNRPSWPRENRSGDGANKYPRPPRERTEGSRPSWSQGDRPRSFERRSYPSGPQQRDRPYNPEYRAPRERDGQSQGDRPYRPRSTSNFGDRPSGPPRFPRPRGSFGAGRPTGSGQGPRRPFNSSQGGPRRRRVVVPGSNES